MNDKPSETPIVSPWAAVLTVIARVGSEYARSKAIRREAVLAAMNPAEQAEYLERERVREEREARLRKHREGAWERFYARLEASPESEEYQLACSKFGEHGEDCLSSDSLTGFHCGHSEGKSEHCCWCETGEIYSEADA